MVLSAGRPVHLRAGRPSGEDTGVTRRRPGAAAIPRRGGVRQRSARLPRRARASCPATSGPAPPRWTASRSTRSSARCSPAATASHRIGDRVVGWASGFDGLMEHVVADGDGLAPYDPTLSAAARGRRCSRWRACSTRSSSCPSSTACHVAVIGQGSIGLLFSYVAKAAGARTRHRRRSGRPRRGRQGVRRRHRRPRHQRPLGEPPRAARPSPTSSSRPSATRSRRSAMRSRRPRSAARCSTSVSPTTTATRSACARCCATT